MGDIQKLTKTEQEVLDFIFSNNFSIKDIANRRQTTIRAVYHTIKKLNKKGWKINKKTITSKKGGMVKPNIQKGILKIWRYHALQFEIKPYYFFPRYDRFRKEQGNRCFSYSDWRIALYKSKVIIWLKAGVDFQDKDMYKAIEKAEHSFDKTLFEISNRYGFEYKKNKQVNIKLLNHHLAYTNPEEFDTITKDKVFITFRGEDGRIFLQYDKSKGMEEREYVHSDSCIDDAEVLERHFNSMRNPKVMTLDEMQGKIGEIIQLLGNSIRGQEVNSLMLNKMLNLFSPQQIPKDIKKTEQKSIHNYIG